MSSQPSPQEKADPIALARDNWERSGWGEVADGMVAVTSVMQAHQILLARVETALRPYDLSFSRYELLRLLAFSRSGALPITNVRPAAGARHQRHADSAAGGQRAGGADPASDRRPHHVGADHRAWPLDGRGRDRDFEQRGFRRHRNVRRRVTHARQVDRDAAPPRRRLLRVTASLASSEQTEKHPTRRSRNVCVYSRRGRQRDRRRHGGARAGARSDVQPPADQFGPFGHRRQAVAAHLVAAQRMLEGVETDPVVDDFESGGVVVDEQRKSAAARRVGVLDDVLQALLGDAVQRELDVLGRPGVGQVDLHLDLQDGSGRRPARRPARGRRAPAVGVRRSPRALPAASNRPVRGLSRAARAAPGSSTTWVAASSRYDSTARPLRDAVLDVTGQPASFDLLRLDHLLDEVLVRAFAGHQLAVQPGLVRSAP